MTDPPVSAATRLFLVLGDPVAHSLSPRFQNAAIRARGIDALFAALRCDADAVAPLIRALCAAGGGGNVTVPHKSVAARCIERPSEAVTRTGACNTFWGVEGVVHGDNTDIAGFRAAARDLTGELGGASALVFGAGGAAAAAIAGLLDEGARNVLVLNRTPARAADLAQRLDPSGAVVRVAQTAAEARDSFDLVVNATSVGAGGGRAEMPFDLSICVRVGAALDLVYAPDGRTAFVSHALDLGIPASDGTTMLLEQGARAFERWFGGEAPREVMRAALLDGGARLRPHGSSG